MRNLVLNLLFVFGSVCLPAWGQGFHADIKGIRLNCQNALSNNVSDKIDLSKDDEPNLKVKIGGLTRKVYIVTRAYYSDWYTSREHDHQIEAQPEDSRLPLPSVKIKNMLYFWYKVGIGTIYDMVTRGDASKEVLEFAAGPNGELTAARVREIYHSLDSSKYSKRNRYRFNIKIGDMTFKGEEFFELVKQANDHGFLSIDAEKGFGESRGGLLAVGVSQLHAFLSRAIVAVWAGANIYIHYGGGDTIQFVQQTADIAHMGLISYFLLGGATSFLQKLYWQEEDGSILKPNWLKKLLYFLPDIKGLKDSSQYSIVKEQRAKQLAENLEKAVQVYPLWTEIVIVTNNPEESDWIEEAMKERFAVRP